MLATFKYETMNIVRDKPTKMIDIFKSTKIWEYFKDIASSEKVELVEKFTNDAIGILARIIETFPTYTLHDGQYLWASKHSILK